MDKHLLLLWLTLREFQRLGLPERYGGANIWSKVIFLLQEKGLPFGYWFVWYGYGPYSDQLREDTVSCSYYQEDRVFNGTQLSEWKLSVDILQKIQQIVDGLKPAAGDITLAQQILFAANCLYVQVQEGLETEAVITDIQHRHPSWRFDQETMVTFLQSFPRVKQSSAA